MIDAVDVTWYFLFIIYNFGQCLHMTVTYWDISHKWLQTWKRRAEQYNLFIITSLARNRFFLIGVIFLCIDEETKAFHPKISCKQNYLIKSIYISYQNKQTFDCNNIQQQTKHLTKYRVSLYGHFSNKQRFSCSYQHSNKRKKGFRQIFLCPDANIFIQQQQTTHLKVYSFQKSVLVAFLLRMLSLCLTKKFFELFFLIWALRLRYILQIFGWFVGGSLRVLLKFSFFPVTSTLTLPSSKNVLL